MSKSIILTDHEAACKNLGLIVRPVVPQPNRIRNGLPFKLIKFGEFPWGADICEKINPPWQPGQVLAVREAWAIENLELLKMPVYDGGQNPDWIYYRDPVHENTGLSWRSPATMPLWASRRELRIESVTCKLVSEVTEEEAVRAGVGSGFKMNAGWPDYQSINKSGICELTQDTAYASFWSLWNKRYGKRYPFDTAWAWLAKVREVE